MKMKETRGNAKSMMDGSSGYSTDRRKNTLTELKLWENKQG
jgi:hypothetical protein